LNLFYLLS
jgi:hypothetical protein